MSFVGAYIKWNGVHKKLFENRGNFFPTVHTLFLVVIVDGFTLFRWTNHNKQQTQR